MKRKNVLKKEIHYLWVRRKLIFEKGMNSFDLYQ